MFLAGIFSIPLKRLGLWYILLTVHITLDYDCLKIGRSSKETQTGLKKMQ